MANPVVNSPFQSGFRLFRGEDLNANLASPGLSTQQSVTAHSGGTRAAATPIVAAVTNVTTVAASADSIVLPAASAVLGQTFTVYNNGANPLTTYALGSDTINGTAGATGVSLTAGGTAYYTAIASGVWIADQSGGDQTALRLDGATSGTTTLQAFAVAGSTTQTLPAVTGTVASTTGSNLFIADVYRSSAAITANATVTPQTITGLAGAVAVGTYRFRAVLPSTVANGTGGIAYNFLLTTAVLSSIQYGATMLTASAVQYTQGTTTTSGTVIASQAAVVLQTIIEGVFIVSTAGTFTLQMAQAVSNASNSVTLINSTLDLIRIA